MSRESSDPIRVGCPPRAGRRPTRAGQRSRRGHVSSLVRPGRESGAGWPGGSRSSEKNERENASRKSYFRPTSPDAARARRSRPALRFPGARSLLLSFGPSPTRLRHRYADPAPPGRSRAPGFCSLYWCVVSVSPPRHSRCVARDPWRRPVMCGTLACCRIPPLHQPWLSMSFAEAAAAC